MEITLKKETLQNILIVEDMDYRIEWFKEFFKDIPNVVYVKKAGPGAEQVRTVKFDLIFLDHDLEPEHYQSAIMSREIPEDATTGLYVAKQLLGSPNAETWVIIHSMNPVGAANMEAVRPLNTVQFPFSMLINGLKLV